MAGPTSAITRFDLSLSYTEFSTLANRRKFIGLKVLPPLGVSQEASDFLRIKVASVLGKPEDTRRAPKSTYRRDDFDWDKDTYACEEHGVEEVADDATIERYGDIIRVEQIAVMRAVNRILQALENDIAKATFNSAFWTGANFTTAIAHPWDTDTAADPIADIDAAREKVKNNCGMTPNTLILSDSAFLSMIRTPRVEGLLKYDASAVLFAVQSGQNQQVLTSSLSALAGLLNVDQVLIGQGFKSTADNGQTATFGRYWDTTKAMLCHVNDDGMNGDLEAVMPNIGRTIFSTKNGEPLPGSDDAGYGSLLFDEYRDEPVRGSVFRPRNKRQVKVLHKEAGHLLTGVRSA